MIKINSVILLLILLMGCSTQEELKFYVSPAGSDSNQGTAEQPFKSLIQARNAIRTLDEKQRHNNITVYLKEGHYKLTETVVFGLEDSAPDGYQYVYQAEEGASPVLSSGIKLNSWSKTSPHNKRLPQVAKGKVWEVSLPEQAPYPYVLFDGLERLQRARGQGFQGKQLPFSKFATRNVSKREDRYLLKRLPFPQGLIKNWENIEDAEAIFCPVPWCINFSPIEKVDEENNIAWLKLEANSPPFTTPKDYNPAFVENMIEFLDEPGEWVYDSKQRKIYYWPKDGDPGENIIAPGLLEYVRIEGGIDYDGATDQAVKNLHFKGLTFAHGNRYTWRDDHKGWGIQHDWDMFDEGNALMRFRGAENCSVSGCRFTASGNSALRLDLHCQNISIENNLIDYVGHMGILLCGYGPGTKDVNKNNRIVNNVIDHCGEVIWHGHAIFIWQSGENYVANNLIQNCPRKAVGICGVRGAIFMEGPGVNWDEASKTLRWNELDPLLLEKGNVTQERILPYLHARNNLIENNEIFRCRTKIGDGSSLNVSGAGTGNVVRNNFLNEVVGNGLRTDDWQRGTTFSSNLICSGGIVHKGHNHILNNIFINTNIRFTTYPQQQPYPGSKVENNVMYFTRAGIDPYTERKAGNIYTPDDCNLKNNLYFNSVQEEKLTEFLKYVQDVKGWDRGSLQADPLFVNPIPEYRKIQKEDLALRENSPVFKMGFTKIALDSIGLTKLYPEVLKSKIFPAFSGHLISSNAALTVSSIQTSVKNYKKILLQSKDESNISYTLKTQKEQDPYIILNLGSQKKLSGFKIIGSHKSGDDAFKSLNLSISDDGKQWKEIWTNDKDHTKTGRIWDKVFHASHRALYVKIGLKGRDTLTLKNVWLYGN